MLLKKGTGPGCTYDLGVPRGSSSPDARRYLSVYLHIWFPSGDRLFSLFMISVSSQIVFDVFSSQDQTNALSPLNCMRFERVRKDSMGEPRSSSHIFLSSVVRKSQNRPPMSPTNYQDVLQGGSGFFPKPPYCTYSSVSVLVSDGLMSNPEPKSAAFELLNTDTVDSKIILSVW